MNSVYIQIADCCLDQLRSEQKSIFFCRNATRSASICRRNATPGAPHGATVGRQLCRDQQPQQEMGRAIRHFGQIFWANVLSPDFFRKWTFDFNQQFLYPFFGGRKSSNFFGQRPCEKHFFGNWKQLHSDPDCRASFSPSLICISC